MGKMGKLDGETLVGGNIIILDPDNVRYIYYRQDELSSSKSLIEKCSHAGT